MEAPPTLFAANRSHIEVVGKISPLKTTMGIKDEMYVSYVVIPTKDRDQIILGRECMTKYHVLVVLVRREARVYLPDGGSPSLDVMQIDEAGEWTPVTLEEFVTRGICRPRGRAVTFSTQPEMEVMEVTAGEDDTDQTDDGMSCDTFDPAAPTAPKEILIWEAAVPIAVDDEAWMSVSSTRDIPSWTICTPYSFLESLINFEALSWVTSMPSPKTSWILDTLTSWNTASS